MAKTGVVLLGKSYNSSRIVVDLIFSCIDWIYKATDKTLLRHMDYDVDAINESQMVEKSYSKAAQELKRGKMMIKVCGVVAIFVGTHVVLAMLASYLY